MSSFNPGAGQPPKKKETVYEGPNPYAVSSSMGAGAQGAAAQKETVYTGPTSAAESLNQPVITAARAAQMNDARIAAKRAAEARFKKISVWMFINAGLLGLEAALFWNIVAIAGISAAVLAVVYIMLAVSTRHMNKTVFLIGFLAYAAQTALYVVLMFTTEIGAFILIRPLLIKGFVLYRLNSIYGELKAYHED